MPKGTLQAEAELAAPTTPAMKTEVPKVPGVFANEPTAEEGERSGDTVLRTCGRHWPSLLPFFLGVLAQYALTLLLSQAGGATAGCLEIGEAKLSLVRADVDMEARMARQERQLSELVRMMQDSAGRGAHDLQEPGAGSDLGRTQRTSLEQIVPTEAIAFEGSVAKAFALQNDSYGAIHEDEGSSSSLRPKLALASFPGPDAHAERRQDEGTAVWEAVDVAKFAAALLTWVGLVISFGVLHTKMSKASGLDDEPGAPGQPGAAFGLTCERIKNHPAMDAPIGASLTAA